MIAALVQATPLLLVLVVGIALNMPSSKDTPGRWWDA